MKNHNKAQQSKNRVHISWDILYTTNIQIRPDIVKYDMKSYNKTELSAMSVIQQFTL